MGKDNIPYDSVVNCAVAVYQCISKRNDSLISFNSLNRVRIKMRQSIESFAGNLEFPFDGRLKLVVRQIILQRFIRGKAAYRFDRLADIFEQSSGFKPHTAVRDTD